MARASSARTFGLTSLDERLASVRARFAPSPMIRPASGRLRQCGRVGARRDEDQLVEDRRRGVDLVAVDGRRLVRPLDDAARDQLRGRLASPPSASASGVSQIARRWTVRPPRRRSAEAATRTHVSRSRFAGVPRPTTSSRPPAVSPPDAERARVPLAGQLAERGKAWQLAAGPPIELAELAVEGRRGGDRHDQDVRGRPTADR